MNTKCLCVSTRKEVEAKAKSFCYITIPMNVYSELCGYVNGVDTEISGCGMIEKFEHKDDEDIVTEFRITEVFLPTKQSNSAGATDIEEEEVHKLMTTLLQAGKDTSKLKLHWHSHANMSVFHSGTDEENYTDLKNDEFLVSLVLNKNNEVLGRIDLYKPLQVSLVHIPVYVIVEFNDADVVKKVDNNLKELNKNSIIETAAYNWRGWKDWNDDSEYSSYGLDKVPKNKTKKLSGIDLQERASIEKDCKNIIAGELGLSEADMIMFDTCPSKSEGCSRCTRYSECTNYHYSLADYMGAYGYD